MGIKTIYISGKISGLPISEVISKFQRACAKVKRFGLEPKNPLDNGLPWDAAWEDQMGKDISILLRCDAIYLLPDYLESDGAKIELAVARQRQMPIFIDATITPKNRPAGAKELKRYE